MTVLDWIQMLVRAKYMKTSLFPIGRTFQVIFFMPLLFSLQSGLTAQQSLVFHHLGAEEGLSQSTVFATTQDSLGFIWFGTRDGLNRYDGCEFEVFQSDDRDSTKLGCDDVRLLYPDANKNDLWIGTKRGLSRMNLSSYQFTNFNHSSSDSTTLTSDIITTIFRDSHDRLWVGTADGLNLLDKSESHFHRISDDELNLEPGQSITVISEDQMGVIWIGTNTGSYQLHASEDQDYSLTKITFVNDFSGVLARAHIRHFVMDSTSLWIISRSSGIFKVDLVDRLVVQHVPMANPDKSSLTRNAVQCIHRDDEENLWVGTLQGLYLLPPGGDSLFSVISSDGKSISGNSIRSVFKDRSGCLWVGAYNGAINYHHKNNSRFLHHLPFSGTTTNQRERISSFLEDDVGNVLIGHEEGGLSYFLSNEEKFVVPPIQKKFQERMEVPRVKKLLAGNGKIYVGTYRGGLYVYDPTKDDYQRHCISCVDRPNLSSNNVYDIDIINTELWLATYGGGINIIDLNSTEIRHLRSLPHDTSSLGSDLVRCILQDSWGKIWVGTEGGLDLVRQRRPDNFGVKHVLPGVDIYALQEDKKGGLWIGTFSKGLFGLDSQNGDLVHYTKLNGLPSNTIFGIIADDSGYLWISTSNGLSKFDPDRQLFTNFGTADGLKNLEFNYNASTQLSNGEILFGGRIGFVRFEPVMIKEGKYSPQVALTKFVARGMQVSPGHQRAPFNGLHSANRVSLPLTDAVFEIGFAALDFFNPENHHYRYRLDGLEEQWNHSLGTTVARYAIQNPGTYYLLVNGSSSTGVPFRNEIKLEIEVLPPMYRTWWAYGLYAIILFTFIYFLVAQTRLRHKLQFETLSKKNEQRLYDLRTKYFVNITHEIRTPLTLITGPLSRIIADYKSDPVLVRRLAKVQKNSQRLLSVANQLLAFQKLELEHGKLDLCKNDIVGFLKDTFLSFEDTAQGRRINYQFDCDSNQLLILFDADKVRKVVTNLLANAFKYTEDGGEIRLRLRTDDLSILVSVIDTGIGIPTEHLDHIFKRFYELESPGHKTLSNSGVGLSICKDLITIHGGEIWVESEFGTGSVFSFRLPITRQASTTQLMAEPTISNREGMKMSPSDTVQELSNGATERAHIMIVDDDPEIAAFVASLLSQDYQVTIVNAAEECFEKALQINPAIIICDIIMPHMNGFQLCQQLKSQIETEHLPILFLTARDTPETKIAGLKFGAEAFLTKPFDPEELIIRVRNLVNSRKKLYDRINRVTNIQPRKIKVSSTDEVFLDRAIDVVEKHIGDPNFDVFIFAQELAVSRASLFAKLKKTSSMTPNTFIKTIRLKRAAQILKQGSGNVSEVAYAVGFKDPKYFARCFANQFAIPPSQYNSQNSGN